MYNKLLQRQISKHLAQIPIQEEVAKLLDTINASYERFEQDRKLLERAIEISSNEMLELNISQRNALNELNTLFENIEEVFFSINFVDFQVLQISPAFFNVYGYTQEEFKANPQLLVDRILEVDKSAFKLCLEEMSSGQSFTMEYRIRMKDGSEKWVETKIKPTLNKAGNLIRIDGVTSDIAKRKEAELSKTENENKYRNLFEKMVDGVYKSSHEGRFIEANPALISMLGYESKEELFAINIKTQLYFDAQERDNAIFHDKLEKISVFRLKKKDGNGIWVEDRGQYVNDEAGNILYHEGILRDVTDRISAQEAIIEANTTLRHTIERLKEAQEVAHICNFVIDLKTKTSIRSLEFYRIFQCNENDFPNTLYALIHCWHPSDRLVVKEKVLKVLRQHQSVDFESRLLFNNGTIKHIHTHIKSIEAENGEKVKIIGTIQDITNQKLIQEELERNIVGLQKSNSELDKFVYSVSHDLRAPLSSILGVVELAQDDTQDPLMIENLNMIRGNIEKLDGFITDILDYSRNSRTEIKREEIKFNEEIENISKNLKYMGGSHRRVEIVIDIDDKGGFYSDRGRLNIILNNLVSNAIRYQKSEISNPSVTVIVKTSKKAAVLVIQDNGIGIKQELHDKIFDMFYRVSENSIGSGLGLYIVKEAIEKLKGTIEIESELGQGTKFTINIPNSLN